MTLPPWWKSCCTLGSSAMGKVAWVLLGVAVLTVAPAVARAEPRPNIYGCGIVWGDWLGLSDAGAREFDRRSMDKIVQMGGTNCPANLAWIGIEPVEGMYDWSYVDHQVDAALARGLEIFAYTGLTPDWALPPGLLQQYGSGIGYRFPPDEQYIPQFEDFFRTLATRYRGRVKYYEFWNEPNGCSWINEDCSNGHMAHTYTPWLIRWYTAMKQGDPDCVLAVGGLDYNEFVTEGWRYIEDIYSNGGGDFFDAVAIHPYGWPLHWQAITDTYQVLVNHGDGHKKLWLNEFGWNTSNEAEKAANVTAVLSELKKPEYHMVFQANYLVITDLPGTPDNGHDYGLCSRNMSNLTITPRQSWYAFQTLNKTFPTEIDFAADVTAGPLPFTVHFTDLSYYPGATGWAWTFGDGGTSNQRNPVHTYTQDGLYTVRLVVNGPSGQRFEEKLDYITAGVIPPIPDVVNPSFEDNGGSLTGWEIHRTSGEWPDNPPWSNVNPWGLNTTAGTHFAGKVTSGLRMDFYLGQIVGASNWSSLGAGATWQLSAAVHMHCSHENQPEPTGVRQVWEIGWNDDGSEPADVMSCDHYQLVADIDGNHTGNHATAFSPLSRRGIIADVPGLRGVAVRVHVSNSASWWWSFNNIDNVQFTLTSVLAPVPGDFDYDGDVDGDDVLHFEACGIGPGVPIDDPNCGDTDLDDDDDADLSDFGILQRCMSGRNIAGDAGCAD